ncbi:MAG TPA: DUF2723 domain-containing protein, partial [Candidatus Limnocylindrales bacterium]
HAEPARRARSRGLTPLAAVAVAASALVVYRATLLPGLGFWDTAEAQTVLPLLGTMHPTGFPAFVVIGWLFSVLARPFGDPAFLTNLLAATCAALAAGATVLVVRRLRVPLPIATAAGVGLAFTPAVWHISTAIDAHALHLLLLVLLTWTLLRWQSLVDGRLDRPGDAAYRRKGDRAIILAAAVFGVAAANHGLALLLVPSIVLFVRAVEPGVLARRKLIVAAVGTALGVAALFYLELPLRAGLFRAPLVYGHPETWQGLLDVVFARQFQGDTLGLLLDPLGKGGELLQLADAQLGPLWVLAVAAFVVTAYRRPQYALFSGSAALVTVVFAASYENADITRYYLGPVFFAWTWLAVTASAAVDATMSFLGAGVPGRRAVAASTALALVLGVALLVPTAAGFSARRAVADRSGDTSAQAWLDQAFSAMADDAVVLSWWSYSTPMWYGQDVEGRRRDIAVIDDSTVTWDKLGTVPQVIDSYLGKRPVYVIRSTASDLEDLAHRYAIQPVGSPGNLFLVTGRLGTTP